MREKEELNKSDEIVYTFVTGRELTRAEVIAAATRLAFPEFCQGEITSLRIVKYILHLNEQENLMEGVL